MNTTPPRDSGKRLRTRAAGAAVAVVVTALGAAGLVSCDSGGDEDRPLTSTEGPTAPDTASFSGSAPSALASAAESAASAARESASSAAASASARESERAASIGAETERSRKQAEDALKGVEGRGNALDQVALTGKPKADTNGLLTAVVTITNRTNEKASYAAQVDFVDPSGKVVETQYVGAEDLPPGDRKQPLAISRRPSDEPLTARLTKAQRY